MQPLLIQLLESCAPNFTSVHLDLMLVLEILCVESMIPAPACGRGRPSEDRRPLFRSFVAKAALNVSETRELIERLHTDESLARVVGYSSRALIPSESTFSRAFAEFAARGYAEFIHAAMIERY